MVVFGVIAINEVWFRLALDRSYVLWFLENGVFIGLAFGLVTVAWGDLNKLVGLTSAHPLQYLLACVAVVTVTFAGVEAMTSARDEAGVGFAWEDGSERSVGLGPVDSVLAFLFAIVFWAIGFAWLIVAAPMQYLVTLIAGAPARRALASRDRSWFDASAAGGVSKIQRGAEAPEEAIETGFTARPVAVTTLVATGLLLVVALLLR
jgi:hypothetical protein